MDPDPPPGGPPGCKHADEADACALHVTGCIHGCTADAAVALASYASCYEGGFHEGMCTGAEKKDKTCAATAGIDADKFAACLADASLIKKIQADVFSRGANVDMFPKVTIGGFPASNKAQDEASFKEALCKHGVKPAC